MYLRYWILLTTLMAIVYASTEPETSKNLEKQLSEQELIRKKRFLFTSALLASKALISAGAFGLGLTKGALIGGGTVVPVYIHHPYPVYRTVYAPSHGWY